VCLGLNHVRKADGRRGSTGGLTRASHAFGTKKQKLDHFSPCLVPLRAASESHGGARVKLQAHQGEPTSADNPAIWMCVVAGVTSLAINSPSPSGESDSYSYTYVPTW
jgi:hypothetical protein